MMSKSAFRIAAIAASASLAMAAAAQAVVITIDDASGDAGTTVPVTVSLNSEGAEVAGTQNDITFGAASVVTVPTTTNEQHYCVINANDKSGTTSSAHPPGCWAATTCTGIRALVLALDNVAPIPTGSV